MSLRFLSSSAFLVGVFVLLLSVASVFAEPSAVDSAAVTPPVFVYVRTAEPPLLDSAAAYIVMDEDTGEVLLEKDADTQRPVASIIKLPVAAAIWADVDLAATTTILASDVAAPEDFGKLAVGDTYTLRELIFPYLMESSNDAGLAIERMIGLESKAATNHLLETIGVAGVVTIDDSNGLSAQTMATPRALASIVRYIAQKEPTIIDITRLPRHLGQAPLVNNSPFIAMPDYRGGKHGYTPAAGHTFAMRTTVPFADGERTLVVVALGMEDQRAVYNDLIALTSTTITRVSAAASSSAILPSSSE